MNGVAAAMRSYDRLNGAKAYTAAAEVVVLYGTVFDDKDRAQRSSSQMAFPGLIKSLTIYARRLANGFRKRSASTRRY